MEGLETAMKEKKRNSSIELLRIVCIFGIIVMHTIAYGGDELSEMNRYLQIFVNCFTNLGVTCFMLISGYFGVRFQLEKLIKLDLMIIFYSFVHIGIRLLLNVPTGKMDVLCAVFPILSNQYWYMTAYFIIVILSKYINQIPERLSMVALRRLLLILLFLLSVVPTFLHFDILGSEGKNVVHMTLIYLIGRYIRIYDERQYDNRKLALVLFGNILVTAVLEMALYAVTGHYSMFYRDCSIFTICSAILLFTLFRNIRFENRFINRVAGSVLAVYVFSFGFQRLVYQFLPLEDYAFSTMLFPRIFLFAPCVVVGCIAVDQLRQLIFGKAETKLSECLAGLLKKGLDAGVKGGMELTEKVLKFVMKS